MKKYALVLGLLVLGAVEAKAADLGLKNLDADARAAVGANNSIMFRRNADQYRQLSPAEKAEIEAQREAARRQAEEYRRKQEEYARQVAEQRAREEAERQRAAALRPITLYNNKLKIYALVNGEVISSNDMQSRINAFILTSGIPYNAQTKDMITSKVLQAAIDEKLKVQEAKKNKIRVSKEEIASAIKEFERGNNMPAGQLQQILAEAKVSMTVWIAQIEADIAWRKLLQSKAFSVAHVSESEISQAIRDMQKSIKVQKFMVSEIVISKKDAKNLNQLVETLRQDPRFELYAMQFSQSPSAANGGRLGWVPKGKMPSTLEQAFVRLKEGGVSSQVLYGDDYYIFKLEKVFNPSYDKQDVPNRKEVRKFLENKKMEEYAIKYIKDLRNRALIEKKF